MITIKETFEPKIFYEKFFPDNKNVLFFDIETTGFSREHNFIYLIGAASIIDKKFTLYQWFAQNPSEEADVIRTFINFSKGCDILIHFNGERFDIPFIKARAARLDIFEDLSFSQSIDLLTLIKPYKKLCGLCNCRQKTIEDFLSVNSRTDLFTGGELIPVYYSYVKKPDKKKLNLLLLHNADDVRCMCSLTLIGIWPDFFNSDFKFHDIKKSSSGIILNYTSNINLPVLHSMNHECFHIHAGGNMLSLGVDFFKGTLKHYYPNYKDYYYLIEEDMVVHKSIAEFIDRSLKKKATKKNCCINKTGCFILQPKEIIRPEFSDKPGNKISYFSIEDLPDSEPFYTVYLKAVLNYLLS